MCFPNLWIFHDIKRSKLITIIIPHQLQESKSTEGHNFFRINDPPEEVWRTSFTLSAQHRVVYIMLQNKYAGSGGNGASSFIFQHYNHVYVSVRWLQEGPSSLTSLLGMQTAERILPQDRLRLAHTNTCTYTRWAEANKWVLKCSLMRL